MQAAGGDRGHRRTRHLARRAQRSRAWRRAAAASRRARSAMVRCRSSATRCWPSSAAATRRWKRRPTSPSSRSEVVIIHRRDAFRASKVMADRALESSEDPGRVELAGHRSDRRRRDHRRATARYPHRVRSGRWRSAASSSRSATRRTPPFSTVSSRRRRRATSRRRSRGAPRPTSKASSRPAT